VGAAVDRIDEAVARFLNYATSNQGFASQRLLWFNEPVSLLYEEGAVRASAVNERIVEVPYAFGAVSRLPTGVKLLDVGATESLVSLSLASLGYDVTALDPRPYPFVHPNLSVVVGLMQEWVPPTQFDCVLCISTIEHIGLGAYGEPVSDARADEAAMSQIWRSTAPGGVLVLTTRFGKPSQDWLHRTYNRDQILALLEGWRIEDEVVVRRAGPLIWTSATSEASRTEESVIMITARKVS
jgi:SAM-dependent methyltransferase